MQRESLGRSLLVATCLCIVCSVFVSSAAVVLKKRQDDNKLHQMQEDVLRVAGLFRENVPISEAFQQVESRVVELETGEFVDPNSIDRNAYDSKMAIKSDKLSVTIPPTDDLAGIKRREKYSPVYLVRNSSGALSQIILPIRGKGLWSTIYGFLSLEPDGRTVHGITFYEHGETPGLGGEIESDKFKGQWKGKVVRDADGSPHISFVRGSVDPNDPNAEHKIDGLAGATLTTRGVTSMVQYWLGPNGFGPFLQNVEREGVSAAEGTASTRSKSGPKERPVERELAVRGHDGRTLQEQ